MNNFEYFNPTRVKFGPGSVSEIGNEARKMGTRAMIVSYADQGVLKSVVDRVESLLTVAGVSFVPFYEITPNPLLSQAERAVKLVKENDAQMIIAVGGGSAMDSAKIIAAGVHYEHEIWKMIVSRHDAQVDIPPTRALPTIMIPTLPATSSEMNCGAVITNDRTTEKSYVFNEVLYPKVSIIDPELTVSLPPYQTALGAADAISHAMETLLNVDNNSPLQLRMAQSVIVTLMELTKKLLQNPKDLELRTQLQWTASVAWNGWTNSGANHGCPMHQLGHVISAFNNVPHGATLSIIMPAWMKYTYTSDLDRYVDMAKALFDIDAGGKTKEETALEAILAFERFLKEIGVPVSLGEEGITADSLDKFTNKVVDVSITKSGNLDARLPINKKDILGIYKLAL